MQRYCTPADWRWPGKKRKSKAEKVLSSFHKAFHENFWLFFRSFWEEVDFRLRQRWMMESRRIRLANAETTKILSTPGRSTKRPKVKRQLSLKTERIFSIPTWTRTTTFSVLTLIALFLSFIYKYYYIFKSIPLFYKVCLHLVTFLL